MGTSICRLDLDFAARVARGHDVAWARLVHPESEPGQILIDTTTGILYCQDAIRGLFLFPLIFRPRHDGQKPRPFPSFEDREARQLNATSRVSSQFPHLSRANPWHSRPHSRYPSSSFFTNFGNAHGLYQVLSAKRIRWGSFAVENVYASCLERERPWSEP
jgi:hypothetical protein